MLNAYGLQAVIDVPTRVGPSSQTAIDQIILNKTIWEYNFNVMATGFLDHYAQILQLHTEHRGARYVYIR